MKRREFLGALAGLAAGSPLAAQAQGDRPRRIGVLMVNTENDPLALRNVAAFQLGLRKSGWIVGRNVAVDYRWGISSPEAAELATRQLLDLAPDLIVAQSVAAAQAARQATASVPIVFTAISEPVSLGLVESLAHPGGNVTGFTNVELSVAGKWLELLKEITPRLTRVAFMFNPDSNRVALQFYRSLETSAARIGIEVVKAPIVDVKEIEPAIAMLGKQAGSGIIFPPDTFLGFNYKLIAELTTRYRLPSIYPFAYYPAEGGLISYGPDVGDQFQRAASYVDRILRGEKAADLPIQQPIKFEFVINLKTAKVLGLTVPTSMLMAADEVIE